MPASWSSIEWKLRQQRRAAKLEAVRQIRAQNMDYELYHDESQVGAFWHGMLLVPQARKTLLLESLNRARSNTRYFDPIGIK